MKRIAAAIIIALTLAGCAGAENPTQPTVTATATTTAATAATTIQTTAPTATGQQTTASESKAETETSKPKHTKPTEPTEKPTKKPKKPTKPTTMPPTQGRTKPNTRVVVTTVRGSFTNSDLSFNGIKPGDSIKKVQKKLGEENAINEISKYRTEYEYDGFLLTTYKEDDKETVEKIELDDTAATPKGAKIGMYATRLRTLYGDPPVTTKNSYTYGNGEILLTFIYADNFVETITYKYVH